MRLTYLFHVAVPILVVACGGTVTTESSGTTSSGATSSGTTSSGATSSGATSSASSSGQGAGGGSSTASSSSTGAGGSTTGTGGAGGSGAGGSGTGGGACTGFVDVVVGNGGPHHLTSDCASDNWNPNGATTALGYLVEGGPPPGVSVLQVFGCASTATSSLGLWFNLGDVKGPGTFMGGMAIYSDGQGTMWQSAGPIEVVVTKLGGVGGTIEGTVKGSLVHPPSQIAQSFSGSFTVCHIPDELTP